MKSRNRIALLAASLGCLWFGGAQAAARTTDREGRRAALAKWWADFRSKGYVDLSGDAKAERLTQLWWVNMYGYASVGYGPVPPKFNGGAGLVQGDRRHWGKDLWYQNTREMIWPMCVAGHPEFAKAILDFYDSCYANVLAHTPERYPEMAVRTADALPRRSSIRARTSRRLLISTGRASR